MVAFAGRVAAARALRTAWLGLAVLVAATPVRGQHAPADADWTADAVVESPRAITDLGLGAVQGVALRDGKLYAYGDLVFARPRIGVVREYDLDLNWTGREVKLTRGGEPLIVHPTGLTWDDARGTFLGDTVPGPAVQKKAVIYRLDWAKAWEDGHLDRAVLDVIDDDAAINGCRPTFVTLGGATYLATSDYGSIRPELRLMDVDKLLAAKRTSAPGVVVHRVLLGPYTQNMHWDAGSGHLSCAQNVVEGLGWRLDVLDLAKAVADGRADGPGVRVRTLTFPSHAELEGYWPLPDGRAALAVARRQDNLLIGSIRPAEARPSPAGTP